MPHRFLPGYPIRHEFWAFGVWQFIFMVLVLAAIALLAVWLIRSFRTHPVAPMGHPPERSSAETALHEARMRYARGELTREQFAQISTDLGQPLAPPVAKEPPAEG
ncbi:MAG: hypothetical protein ACXVQY_00505 [Actinomycetota bacterium]